MTSARRRDSNSRKVTLPDVYPQLRTFSAAPEPRAA